jgi:hypothetical protein
MCNNEGREDIPGEIAVCAKAGKGRVGEGQAVHTGTKGTNEEETPRALGFRKGHQVATQGMS